MPSVRPIWGSRDPRHTRNRAERAGAGRAKLCRSGLGGRPRRCPLGPRTDAGVRRRRPFLSSDARKLRSGDWLERLPTDDKNRNSAPLPPITALVATGSDTVVARMSGPAGDLYFYLRRGADRKWTIEAGRALALPAFVAILRQQREDKKDCTAKEDGTLRNLQLTMKTDAELIQWFGMHHGDLDTLLILGSADGARLTRRGLDDDISEVGNALRKADLRALDAQQSVIRVVIGGVLDNTVGFLRVPVGGKPPPIGACDYIWFEPLGDGWYLYRTT